MAKRLGVSQQTVVNWIKRGFLPGVQFGGRLVVPVTALARVEEINNFVHEVLRPV